MSTPNPARNPIKIFSLTVFLILLLLCTVPSLRAQPQPAKFEHLTIENGLSQNSVLCITQDDQGFMWFGTQDGLNRYDGYRFAVFKHDMLDTNSLSENGIYSIHKGRSGTLWVGTQQGGLNKFNPGTESFTRFIHDSKNPGSLSGNDIRSILEDNAGTLWVGTWGDGLNKMERDQKTFTRFVHNPTNPQGLSSNTILSIYEDRAGILWIGTKEGGLNRLDRATGQFTNFMHNPNDAHSLSNNNVHVIYEDRWNVLWIGTEGGGLNRFDRDNGLFTRFVNDPKDPCSLSDNFVLSICEDHRGTLWIGTWFNGLNKFDRDNECFIRFVNDLKVPNSFGSNTAYAVFEDRSGALWVGTDARGISQLGRDFLEENRFEHFYKTPENSNSLSHNSIRSIYEDSKGILWLGTVGGGLNRFDRDSNRYTNFVEDSNAPFSLSRNVVFSIREDHLGALWIGTVGGSSSSHWIGRANGGLSKLIGYNSGHEHFSHFLHDPKNPRGSLSTNYVRSVYEDHLGVLWIGTLWGLNKFDRESETFTHFLHDSSDSLSLSDNDVYSIYEDRAGILWVGTVLGGLNRFDRETNQFKRFVHDPTNPHSLSHNTVLTILEDGLGSLWVGTTDGLNRLDRSTGKFIHFSEKDGLPNNVVCGILEDDSGHLWMSTNKGLTKFDHSARTFKNYDLSDGLQDNEFNAPAYHKSRRTGEMFFGGINGFNAFHPDSIKDNPYIPPVVITSFKRYNADENGGLPIEEKGISTKKEINLSYKDNILAFEFAALSYNKTFKNRYAYKLEGYSQQWIQLGTERRVNFTNLDPGVYTLRVKGSNNDGVWNEEGTSLRITITPPWWKTWWAYALYAASALALLIAGRRYELSRARLRYQLQHEHAHAEQLAEIDRMKSRFFANISHEFRTPLTLILGPLQKLLAENFATPVQQQLATMQRNAERLQRLISQMLDLARLEANKMSLAARQENLVKLTQSLAMSFLSFAERKRISLEFEAKAENLAAYVDRDKWEKIISNLLSNALKFTPEEGRVSVRVEYACDEDPPRHMEIRVSDTGMGIPAELYEKIFDRFYQADHFNTREHEGTGIGLALTKELVELHHGKILLESEPGKGATFIVRVPLGRAHLQESEIAPATESEESSLSQQSFAGKSPGHDMEEASLGAEENPAPAEAPLVLIVEDNRDLCEYIRGNLESEYRVIKAMEGEAGLEAALAKIPDLIISDIMMPKMDGYALCRRIKTEELTSHIPVILLTARAAREDKLAGLHTGADDYIVKPFDAEELRARVKNLIAQRKKLRERFSREITVQPQDIAITTYDERFLQRAMAIVEEHIADTEFDTEGFAKQMGTSRMQLNRKLRALTDQTTGEFIRTLRLKRAAQLLAKKGGSTIVEIAYEVGFSSPAHFAKCFREQFGLAPSEYVKRNGKEIKPS